MTGWIRLHRKILENGIWQDVTMFRLFTLLLLKASHKDGVKVNGIELKRGQWIRSYSKLAEDLEYREGRGLKKVSKSTILRNIKKLIEQGMISVHETDSGTVFTVLNYEHYQGFDDGEENEHGTVGEPNAERRRNEVGTKTIIKELNNKDIPIVEIVQFLNEMTDKSYKPTTAKTQACIKARWREGFRLDDFKTVIRKKCAEWKHDEQMNKYLRPETLFGTKFESYLNQEEVPNNVHPFPNQKRSGHQSFAEFQAALDEVAARWGG